MHVIRLRWPWEKCDEAGKCRPIDVPEEISEPSHHLGEAAFQYRRNFNQPSGLESGAKVYFRIAGWNGQLQSVAINDHSTVPLEGNPAPLEVDITPWLRSHNQIELRLRSLPGVPARLSGEVTIVIEDLEN